MSFIIGHGPLSRCAVAGAAEAGCDFVLLPQASKPSASSDPHSSFLIAFST
jgi:hypothetical protein